MTLVPAMTTINVTIVVEGIHNYPAAGTDPALADVSFLAFPHRHLFHITANIQVFHADRDLEFILVKRDLLKAFGSNILQLDNKSCEMINADVAQYLASRYGDHRVIVVTTSEDNESGATTTFYPSEAYDALFNRIGYGDGSDAEDAVS